MKKYVNILLCCGVLWGGVQVGNVYAVMLDGDNCKVHREKTRQLTGVIQRKNALEKALQECGNDSVITYRYAYNLERRLKSLRAIDYYQKSIATDPSFPKAYFGMAESQFSIGDLDLAISFYQQGLELSPGNYRAIRRLTKISAMQTLHTDSDSRPEKMKARKQSSPAGAEYYETIANRYGISIRELKDTLQRLSADRKKSAGGVSTPMKDVPVQTKAQTVQKQNKYSKNIADRYGIQLNDLMRSQEQTSTLKSIADRYGLELTELVATNQQTAAQNDKKIPSTEAVPDRQVNPNQKEYLKSVTSRYGIQLDDLVEAQGQAATLNEIADRYDLQLDNMIRASRESGEETYTITQAQAAEDPKKQVLVNKEYYQNIAARYGIRLAALEETRDQMTTLKEVAERYSIPLEDIIQKNPTSGLALTQSVEDVTVDTVNQKKLNEYLENIANRYGLELNRLDEINRQMTALKGVADTYGIAFGELLQANQKVQETAVRSHSLPAESGKVAKQQKYLREIATRYALKLDVVSEINSQMSSLSDIADRYGIKLDDLVKANKASGVFEDERIKIREEHIVSRNDYLSTIASRYSVTVKELLHANRHIKDINLIFPGEVIKIPE